MSILKKDALGPEVATLQAALNYHLPIWPLLEVDSIFGTKTDNRLKAFQRAHNLYPDGDLGPLTEAVLYACVSVNTCAFVSRQPAAAAGFVASTPGPRPASLFPGGPMWVPPSAPPSGGLHIQFPRSLLQQIAAPFPLPANTPASLTPSFTKQAGSGQTLQLPAPSQATAWEFWSLEAMVLSRKFELKFSLEPSKLKMGSLPGHEFNIIGSAKWSILPERLRRPGLFLEASAQTGLPPSSITASAALGLEFRGAFLKATVGGTSAFDVNPQGMIFNFEKTVPEGSAMLFLGWTLPDLGNTRKDR